MKLIIARNDCEFNRIAADEIARQLRKKPDSVLGLPTGSTPVGVYSKLVEMYRKSKVDFSGVITFNLDEYIGIPVTHPCSYHTFMRKNLFRHININPDNIYIPSSQPPSPEEECEEYERKIAKCGGIDLAVLGIGHNGHIGFNEPGTPFEVTTHIATLSASTIKANSRFFGSEKEVPRQAITMGIKTIMKSRKIILLAKGSDKADILHRALCGHISQEVPASVLQLHPCLLVIADKSAASKLEAGNTR